MANNSFGKIYLIPTTLGETEPLEVLPISIKQVIEKTNDFVVENEKTARKFIKKITPQKSQPDLALQALNKYTNAAEIASFILPCLEGRNMGILSEAGCPGIADPGAELVKIAHQRGIQVVPLVGPSSILLAMMASGFNGQSFAFNGYLPIDKSDRKNTLKRLEKVAREQNQSQIFIETPYRNDKLLASLTEVLQKDTMLCVATDITLPTEFIVSKPIVQWKKNTELLHKRPTIFIIHVAKTIGF